MEYSKDEIVVYLLTSF